jgi:ectoine hydroxylase-related dioxygenase (phytanoyl-CoA dioxygenase family)
MRSAASRMAPPALRYDRSMIDAALIEQFQRDGAARIPRLFAPSDIAGLEAGIDLNLSRLSPRAKIASAATDPGRFVEDFCNWQDNPHYRRFIFDTPLAETAGRLMRASSVRLYHDHMLTKEPSTRQPTPWHQDQPYYNIEGRQNISFWIPVDPVSRASTLEFVAGSHRGPWLMPRAFMDAQAKCSRRAVSQTCPTSRRTARTIPFSVGNSSRAMPSAFTC